MCIVLFVSYRVVPGQGIIFMSFETIQGLVQDLVE